MYLIQPCGRRVLRPQLDTAPLGNPWRISARGGWFHMELKRHWVKKGALGVFSSAIVGGSSKQERKGCSISICAVLRQIGRISCSSTSRVAWRQRPKGGASLRSA